METGIKHLINRAIDAHLGQKVEGTVLAVFRKSNGDHKVVVDRGTDSVIVEYPRRESIHSMNGTNIVHSPIYRYGDIFSMRSKQVQSWTEGQEI